MSFRNVADVFDYSQASGNDRLVLLAIAENANDDAREAWPSIREIARKANIDQRTVQRSIRRLQELGELAVVGVVPGELSPSVPVRYRPNLYRLTLTAGVADCHPSDGSGVADSPLGVTETTVRGDRAVSPEPSRTSEPRARRRAPIPDEFTVTGDMVAWARENTPSVDWRMATREFVTYWKGRGEVRADWVQTWKNRLLQVEQRERRFAPGRRSA